MDRRLGHIEILRVLSNSLSTIKDSAIRSSGDGLFSPSAFAMSMEKFFKANPILIKLLNNASIDLNAVGKPFFVASTECLLKRLNEGEYIFNAEEIKCANLALGKVFKLAGGWSADEGVIIDPPGECDLYDSVSEAVNAIERGMEAGTSEMKIY